MGITTSGIFSGINSEEIVSKLMQVESQPLLRLKNKEVDYQAKISAYGTVLAALSNFEGSVTELKDSSLMGMNATSSDTTVFTATAASSASAGTYNIKVNNPATAQSIYSTTFTAETDAVADLSTYTTQKLRFQVGSGAAKEISITSSNNTLSGIKDAINNAGAGVKASIINDGTGYRLVLSANSTGTSNKIVVKVDENNNGTFEEAPDETDTTGLSKLAFNATYDSSGNVTGGIANMTQSQAAKDASLVVDGLTMTRSSNTITDIITGVTINLKTDSSGNTLTLDISKDTGTLKTKINSFVSGYNQVMANIKALRGNSSQRGILTGDSITNSLNNTLRTITTNSYSGNNLAMFGITHDKEGVLSLDSSKLDEALSSNEQDVIDTLNAMAGSLESTLDSYINTVIPNKEDSYNESIRMLDKMEDSMQMRLNKIELDLRKKFAALEQTIAQLQGQGDYLTQQLSNLSKTFGGTK